MIQIIEDYAKEIAEAYNNSNSKKVLVEGTYPSRNKQLKTLIKDSIAKNLKMTKYKNFKLGKAEVLAITGDTITIR